MGKWTIGALLLALVASTAASAAPTTRKLQCWTDHNGVRNCGDRVPPEYAQQERQVMDKQGRVVQVKPREKTPEELAAEENAKKLGEEMAQRRKRQAEYDRYLLDSYSGESDLAKQRDERLAAIDGRIKLAQQSVTDNENTLKGLKARAAAQEKTQQPPDKKLAKQIADFDKGLADSRAAITRMQTDRETTRRKFEDDIARWRELKSSAPPAAASH